jgi:hypothetical protein
LTELTEAMLLKETLYDIVPSEENEYVLSDIFEISSIFPFPKGLRCLSKDFKFDIFTFITRWNLD